MDRRIFRLAGTSISTGMIGTVGSVQRKQEQSGGAGSVNAQAGRDVVIHGITASEAIEIADGVFWKNFLTLGGAAEGILRERVEGTDPANSWTNCKKRTPRDSTAWLIPIC